jgi:hypothetical protein
VLLEPLAWANGRPSAGANPVLGIKLGQGATQDTQYEE